MESDFRSLFAGWFGEVKCLSLPESTSQTGIVKQSRAKILHDDKNAFQGMNRVEDFSIVA
jgi:hypothetical protein